MADSDVSAILDDEPMIQTKFLEIPVRDESGRTSDEAIEISIENLPPVEDLLGILQAEQADLPRWLDFAVEYYGQNRLAEFERILEEGCSPEVEAYYDHDPMGRLIMLNALAAYKITLAHGTPNATYLTDAVDLFSRADKIDDKRGITLVNKGLYSLARNEQSEALNQFTQALELDPNNLLAKLGRAAMLFKKRQFKEARDLYKRAIRDHPGCSPTVRVNLGLCFYELGLESRAVECFERALDMDDEDANALVALAVIELGRAQMNQTGLDVQMSQKAMGRLRKAYALQGSNSLVLTHLANHFFFMESDSVRDYSRIESLARKAYKNTDNAEIRAEAAYILGRNFHEQGDFASAKDFYDRSLKHWPDFTLAQFAKAQMLLFKSEKTMAVSLSKNPDKEKKRKQTVEQTRMKASGIFEKVSKDYKTDRDTSTFAAWTMSRMNRRQPAQSLLRQVTQLHPEDTEAWLELARIQQKEDVLSQTKKGKREALRAYTKAAKGMQPMPSAFVYNNIGTLQFELHELRGALATFKEGLTKHADKIDPEDSITLRFNLARVLEETGDFDEAESIYKQLVEETEGLYSNAILRLGSIAEAHGLFKQAEEYYDTASKQPFNKEDSYALLGKLAARKGELKRAKEYFSKVGDKNRPDSFCKLSLANIALIAIAHQKPESEEYKQGVEYARDWYRKILERNHGNIFASNGLANCLAMLDSKKEARQIWERLREPDDAPTSSVWMNLGHLAMEEERYDSAMSLYQQCMKRFKLESDPEMHMFLANTYFHVNKFEEAEMALKRAIHLDPSNLSYRLNLATLLCEYGSNICDNKETLTPKLVNKAVSMFQIAKQLFEWLAGSNHNAAASIAVSSSKRERFLQEPSSPGGSPSDFNFTFLEKQKANELNPPETGSQRPLSVRAPRSLDPFKHADKANEGVVAVNVLLEKSAQHVAWAQTKAAFDLEQRRKLDEESKFLQEKKKQLDEEKEASERKKNQELEKQVNAQQAALDEHKAQWKGKNVEGKKKKERKGKKGKKAAVSQEGDEERFVDDDSGSESAGPESEDDANNDDSAGEIDFDPQAEKKSREESSVGEKRKKKKKKSKKKKVESSSEEDLFGEDEDMEVNESTAVEPISEPPRKKTKVIESDDEAEL